MTVIAYTKRTKKTQKNPKKPRKFPQKLTLPGFDRYKIPQKCTKKSLTYSLLFSDGRLTTLARLGLLRRRLCSPRLPPSLSRSRQCLLLHIGDPDALISAKSNTAVGSTKSAPVLAERVTWRRRQQRPLDSLSDTVHVCPCRCDRGHPRSCRR